jgi:hypothetical protein
VEAPAAYAIDESDRNIVRALWLHGVTVERLQEPARVDVSAFAIDSVSHARRVFQGHYESRAWGRWRIERRTLPTGTLVVPTSQALGALAMYLLEPESDDGLVTWNTLDDELRRGADFPVVRIDAPLAVARRSLPPR